MIAENIDIVWKILGITAVILLIVSWHKHNAVWGGLTLGAIAGSIIAIFFLLTGDRFDWYIIGKGAILGPLFGFTTETPGKVSDFFKS